MKLKMTRTPNLAGQGTVRGETFAGHGPEDTVSGGRLVHKGSGAGYDV
ncbi:hypothetical protein [Mobiluncus curtisii]|uniref:Uncharacterized protein n=1 Tax=Mobiluncus curtisii TaxID=2051 RepID=A0A7Y0UG91_9ACTO|nr:hypothetical protein [Mobiluncus curtisii]NMW49077.1 hypothetical protein [Mobiluncus curtisii]NMW82979.1 hypothetical protein [Mobiluncus curtisii]NMW86776.1 hypothetical protein [Mobiluncus curtisii]